MCYILCIGRKCILIILLLSSRARYKKTRSVFPVSRGGGGGSVYIIVNTGQQCARVRGASRRRASFEPEQLRRRVGKTSCTRAAALYNITGPTMQPAVLRCARVAVLIYSLQRRRRRPRPNGKYHHNIILYLSYDIIRKSVFDV